MPMFKINDQYHSNTKQFADFAAEQPEIRNEGSGEMLAENNHVTTSTIFEIPIPLISDEKGWYTIWERYKWTVLAKQAFHGLTGD